MERSRPCRGFSFCSRASFAVGSLVVLSAIAAVYHKTLDVPFYLDDLWSIRDNPSVKAFSIRELFENYPTRFLTYLSFALNVRLHGLWLPGFHLVNLALHAANSLLVLALSLKIGERLGLKERSRFALALLAALLFALHPLQTQAVNYTVQRAALLAACGYLLGLLAYLKARCDCSPAWFLLAGAALGLGLLSKENIVTLPLAWLLLELVLFFRPFAVVLSVALLGALLLFWTAVNVSDHPLFRWLDQRTRETDWFSRSDYFAAQMGVLWHYLRLFFWPKGLRLDYGLHDPPPLSAPSVWLALAGHLLLVGAALALLRRRPAVAFGLLFYYLAHAVESSVIPIKDLVFEHRTYLPNFGLALTSSWLLTQELPRKLSGRVVAALSSALLLLLAVLTYQRNQIWRDPVALWRDNVQKAPHAIRAWQELAAAYRARGEMASWWETVRRMVELPRPRRLPDSTLYNLALYYYLAGKMQEAEEAAREALSRNLSARERGYMELVLGKVARRSGRPEEALAHLCRAAESHPELVEKALKELAQITHLPLKAACPPCSPSSWPPPVPGGW